MGAPGGFQETLETTARALNRTGHRWVIVGGAALALHGLNVDDVNDIDILVSGNVAAELQQTWSLHNHADSVSRRFRSAYVLRPHFGTIPVEILGDFQVRASGRWQGVVVETVTEVTAGGQKIPIPERAELAAIFELCGRRRDRARARLLRANR